MLTAANPFDPKDTIAGCPHCKSINTLEEACDEPGCWRPSTCGIPTSGGYRRTCSEHMPKEDTGREKFKGVTLKG